MILSGMVALALENLATNVAIQSANEAPLFAVIPIGVIYRKSKGKLQRWHSMAVGFVTLHEWVKLIPRPLRASISLYAPGLSGSLAKPFAFPSPSGCTMWLSDYSSTDMSLEYPSSCLSTRLEHYHSSHLRDLRCRFFEISLSQPRLA